MVDNTRRNDNEIPVSKTANDKTTTTRAAGTTTHRTGTAHTAHATNHAVDKASAAKKGLWVGILTFLALTLIDWLSGPTLSSLEALTFLDVIVYAVIGIIVGLAVKLIDLSRQKSAHSSTHHA